MRTLAVVGIACALVACGGAEPKPPAAPASGAETAPPPAPGATAGAAGAAGAPTTFAEQAALGQTLYGEHCAMCHGDTGNNGKAPPLVGLDKGALPKEPPAGAKYRTQTFHTAADVADFVVKAMPPKAPGSLTAEQYWAILAFDLKANGVTLDHPLDAESAKGVVIHP